MSGKSEAKGTKMANNYRVRVEIEVEECTEDTTEGPRREDSGVFEWVVSAEQARSIDGIEKIMLETNSEALRDAFAHYLSEVSRQYALEVAGSLEACKVQPYRVDSEMGRVRFDVYWIEQGEDNNGIAGMLFPVLRAREWYRTTGLKEIALVYGTTEESYRQAGELINRVRHQANATPFRTLRENTEYEGQQIMAFMDQQATEILDRHGFETDGTPREEAVDYSEQVLVTLPAEQVSQAIQTCAPESEWIAEMTANPVAYEDPAHSAQISIDDVNVKRQKASRKDNQEPAQPHKYVHNTVAHVAHAGASYIINGVGAIAVLRLILAFLLHNHLLQYNLLFFVDGQRTLYTAILSAFAWLPALQVILDWYHLEKRCKEQLSLALNGRVIRNSLLDQLRPCLWHGCVDRAIAVLQAVAPHQIKNQEALDTLIEYLLRNRPYIPCYAVRKSLSLRNSSNQGEKANDLVVSDRQKHNGMSWSKPGSVALAALTSLVKNQEYLRWFHTGTLSFSFCASC
jgi:hypothetical protein